MRRERETLEKEKEGRWKSRERVGRRNSIDEGMGDERNGRYMLVEQEGRKEDRQKKSRMMGERKSGKV